MFSKDGEVNAKTCEQLLKSAHKLIANAHSLAPQYLSQSSAFQEIRSLVSEFSSLKSVSIDNFSTSNLKDDKVVRSKVIPTSNIEGSAIADLSSDGADSMFDEELVHGLYQSWVNNHWLTENQAQLMAERMSLQWKKSPSIAIFIIHNRESDALLTNTIQSLQNQLYKNWTLTVVSERSRDECLVDTSLVTNWVQHADTYSAMNQAMIAVTSDWLTLLRPGDRLAIHGLFSIADYDNLRGEQWRLIYHDEDYIDDQGERCTPLFKPDINIEYLRSYPYIGRFCFFRKSLLLALGGFPKVATCYNESLVFHAVEFYGEASIGHIDDVLGHRCGNNDDSLSDVDETEWRQLVSAHLSRRCTDAIVAEGYLPKTNRVIYQYSGEPLITVIVPTKDRPDLIEPCITSLFEITNYKNFELIIVDNGSDSEDVFYYYDQWQKSHGDRVRILSYDKPFNFSAMNNHAAKHANGEYLLLLNNDTEIINGDWMERMLSHASRPDVGVVGARLLFPEGAIQHAGVVLGLSDSASHPGGGDDFLKPGYMGRYQVDQNFSAVTAACMMTSREVYQQLGGLNEDDFEVLFNDVDYCLRVKEEGYQIVWTPYATLVHKPSSSLAKTRFDEASMDRSRTECSHLISRWRDVIRSDPAYNSNLSLHRSDYVADSSFSPRWNSDFPMRPKVFALPQDYFGCGNYRVCSPLNALSDELMAEIHVGPRQDIYMGPPPVPTVTDIIRMCPDVVFIQAVLSHELILSAREYRRNTDIPLITDIDDLKTDLPEKNCNKRFIAKDVRSRLRKFLANFDLLTVSTEPLALVYKEMVNDVVVIPNRIDSKIWGGLSSQRRTSSKPRVGWVGAQQHQGDLEIIVDVVKQTAHEIDWIFMGMCLDELKPFVKEIHEFEINFADFPAKMAGLNLDLAVAPLEVHPFNEAKSNLRLLEYGILGWPVVCTDIYPYQNAPVKRVNNTTAEWLTAIRERIYDLDSAAREGDALKNWVLEHWILQDHLDEWVQNLLQTGKGRTISKIA